jgi:hypothetical protein
MTLLVDMAQRVGRYRGTNRLHDPYTQAPENSPTELLLEPVLGGRFFRLAYTWAYRGQPQEGFCCWEPSPRRLRYPPIGSIAGTCSTR